MITVTVNGAFLEKLLFLTSQIVLDKLFCNLDFGRIQGVIEMGATVGFLVLKHTP